MFLKAAQRLFVAGCLAACAALAWAVPGERFYYGTVYGAVRSEGQPVPGAMVTFYHGDPVHSLTVFADEKGRYLTPELPWSEGYSLRVRRVGWQDYREATLPTPDGGQRLDLQLARETDFAAVAGKMPGNYWMQLVLEELDERAHKLEFKQQCTYCHQQGTPPTRVNRSRDEWAEVILDMGRRGAVISQSLRDTLPDAFIRAYARDNALKKLSRYRSENGPLPLPDARARRAVIEEWDLGGPTSNQHDLMVYPRDDSIWTVDGPLDTLHNIRFENNPDGERTSYAVPKGDHKPGGVYWRMDKPANPGRPERAYLAPHSLQTAPDGRIWLTLPKGNQLAGFDPRSETWDMVNMEEGINPHTLRFDDQGRLWYTITATNHVGMFDPQTRKQAYVRLKSPDFATSLQMRFMPLFLRVANWIDMADRSAKMDGISVPMPYGIDIHPGDGSVWYSQLNFDHIGRIDPETLENTPVPTPFDAPRRLRFDAKGGLWVPGYTGATLNYYNIGSGEWQSWDLPIEPAGSATPYALNIDKRTGHVWICGTASDTMIRFEPETKQFTVYPLPNRVTYTREIDFDSRGNMWTSHSNGPAWHVESGVPKVTRIDPDGAPDIEASGLFDAAEVVAR